MANLCSFSMLIKGSREDRDRFIDTLMYRGNVYTGRGLDIQQREDTDSENETQIDGDVKWGIEESLIDNALSMRDDPSGWYFDEGVDKESLTFLTLWEACERFRVNMEVFGTDPGNGLEEHMKYENGEITKGRKNMYSWDFDLKDAV